MTDQLSLRRRILATITVVVTAAAMFAGIQPASAAPPAPSLKGLCTAYEAIAAHDAAKALSKLSKPPFAALVTAAGGPSKVLAYCDELLGKTPPAPAPPPGWTTTFSDAFNGAANTPIDDNWIYDLGTSYPGGAGNWGTGEVETMTNSTSNVYQDGAGHLVIKPVRDAQGNWTSGRVETARTDFAAPAGGEMEITATIQQPNPDNGLGYWPAFWMMGANARGVGATNWPSIGEADIMEDVNALSEVSHTFHCGVDPGGPCNETTGITSGLLACSGCQTAFHTYSVIIDRTNTSAEQLRFYTDNVLQHTVNESQVPLAAWQAAVDHGFFLILNVAMGGVYPHNVCQCTTPTADTTSGAPMIVDDVSVFTKAADGAVAAPTFSPAGGTYATAQTVTIADATAGADIRYTTDGSAPTVTSPLYTGPITVAADTTVNAIATKPGMADSAAATATYTIGIPVATPTFTPAGGTYATAQTVTIADTTGGADIRYTTDGSTPTASSTLYSGPIAVNATTTINAIATKPGDRDSAVATASYTIGATTCPAQSDTPDFGPNVHIFDPSMSNATIQAELDRQFAAMKDTATAQFSDNRVADFYMPGTYNVEDNVGYYTSVAGLGQNPDDVTINGDVTVDAFNASDAGNATQNFWRSAENLSINPSSGSDRWAVAQAAPFRRIDVHGGLQLYPASFGFASGGYIADTKVTGQASSVSQQQWYTRDSSFGSWSGGVWNMVFSGTTGAPGNTFPIPPETTLATTPVSRDVPYLYVDSAGKYRVFLPSLRTDAIGPSWANGSTPGTSLPMNQFYVVKAGDTAATINNALAQGCNLFVTPGVYHLDQTIDVTRANTVVLGVGFPTFVPDNGVDAMHVADVDGVRLKGLLFDAGTTNSASLLTVGTAGAHTSHATDPTTIQDVFFRIGGEIAGKATTSLIVNSDNTIIDDIWAWRADHGNPGTVGWTVNTADTGLVVNGDNVLATGLFIEHFQKYEVLWNGENGKTIFFQNEMPYDAPDQAAWQHDGVNGYAAYKVASTVQTHEAWGLGSYIYTNVDPTLHSENAFEVPDTPGVVMHDLLTVSLNKAGTIDHVINGIGAAVTPDSAGPTYIVTYPGRPAVATPVISPAGGTYADAQSVTISDATAGASVYYTTDGSAPSASSTLYTGSIEVSATTTITAIGIMAGLDNSPTASATYTIGTATSPDYTQGVTQVDAADAQIWITPTTAAAYVDIHYIVNGGGQQNVRMVLTGGTWTQNVGGLVSGSTIEYWFTYEKNGPQFDTPHFTYTQGPATSAVAKPTSDPASGT